MYVKSKDMNAPSENEALDIVAKVLSKLLGVANCEDSVCCDYQPAVNGYQPDMLLKIRGFLFVVEYKKSSLLGPITKAIELLSQHREQHNDGIPLLVVPYMGESGMSRCSDAEICWLDLSGNMDIRTTDLLFYIKGKSNKFKQPGRRENPFSPKSSRIARRLLYHPRRPYSQKELSDSTGLGEGYVSRIAKTLEEQSLIKRNEDNRLMPKDPKLLLEAWIQGYDFKKHEIIRGHVAGRSGSEVQSKLCDKLMSTNLTFAATGLGAAWAYSQYSSFRLVSLYVKERPSSEFLESIGFRRESSGANVWLIVPKDIDVFYDVNEIDNVPNVHPVQVYLDLKYHPERSVEAAEELLSKLEL